VAEKVFKKKCPKLRPILVKVREGGFP